MNLEQAAARIKAVAQPQDAVLAGELRALREYWKSVQFPIQRPPDTPWHKWDLRGERGSGTTRGAIMELGFMAQEQPNTRWFILVPHGAWASHVLREMMDHALTPTNHKTVRLGRLLIRLDNGSEIRASSMDDHDLMRLRGLRFDGGIVENPARLERVDFIRATLLKPGGKLIVTETRD